MNGHDSAAPEPTIEMRQEMGFGAPQPLRSNNGGSDGSLGIGECAFSAAGTAFLSAIIVDPLDVVKMFADLTCSPSCTRAGVLGTVSICPPDCFQYKGTLDVFNKIICQEGFARLWGGTNAGLALVVLTVGIYLPCYEIFHNWLAGLTTQHASSVTPYVPLFAGSLHNLLPY